MAKISEQPIGAHKVIGKYVAGYRFNSMGPNMSLKTNISKKAIFPAVDESFWPTSFALSSVTNLKGHFIRIQKVFVNYSGSFKIFL